MPLHVAPSWLLSIDQGTTSSRAVLFDRRCALAAVAQKEYPQFYPHEGWVEQDALTIWQDTLALCHEVVQKADISFAQIAGIGITNQRETIVVWNRETGVPIHRAIVWQDRRTAAMCEQLQAEGLGSLVGSKTGLRLDPYFSATKLRWLLEHVPGARAAAEAGKLAAGTIDCFLLWQLTGGQVHATDATNASRTMLYNIRNGEWDQELLRIFNIPAPLLPEVRDTVADFGMMSPEYAKGAHVPIRALVGDQQAATVGQACFAPGMMKATYGTGCFAVLNTGSECVDSQHQLLSTIAYQLVGKPTYALEGSIFIAGAAVKWLRDQAGLIAHASETAALAQSVTSTGGVYFVTAFAGLGAPYWNPHARAALVGMTLGTTKAHIVRAALEAVVYQTRDLMDALAADRGGAMAQTLRVDGGMVANDWLCQYLADVVQVSVERPQLLETTALGAAYLAGLGAGWFGGLDDIAAHWQRDQCFQPNMPATQAEQHYAGWREAVAGIQEMSRG